MPHILTMKLTLPILKDLSHQISHGNPCWGMLVVNEYLKPSSPLHRALATQLLSRVSAINGERGELIEALVAGMPYNKLSPHLQAQVGTREVFIRGRSLPSHLSSKRPIRTGDRRLPLTTTSVVRRPIRRGVGHRATPARRIMNLGSSSDAPRATPRAARMLWSVR